MKTGGELIGPVDSSLVPAVESKSVMSMELGPHMKYAAVAINIP